VNIDCGRAELQPNIDALCAPVPASELEEIPQGIGFQWDRITFINSLPPERKREIDRRAGRTYYWKNRERWLAYARERSIERRHQNAKFQHAVASILAVCKQRIENLSYDFLTDE
jgi:hypothetical protein